MNNKAANTERPFRRHNGKCKACGRKASVLARFTSNVKVGGTWRRGYETEQGTQLFGVDNGGEILIPCCTVDGRQRFIVLSRVEGRYNPAIKCNAKCESATRHVCECSCSGKNHGCANTLGGI